MQPCVKGFVLTSAAFLLSGCISLTNFTKHPDSGTSDQVVNVTSGFNYQDPTDSGIEQEIAKNSGLKSAVISACGTARVAPNSVAVLGPIAVALGRLVFDRLTEAELKKLEELKKASSATYSGTVFFDDGTALKARKCFLLIRSAKGSEVPTFLALVALRDRGDAAFTIEPRYVQAINAVAVTAAEKAAISASLALAIKTVPLPKKDGGPSELTAAGQGAVSVTGVKMDKGKSAYTCTPPKCPSSDLIPYPSQQRPISVTFSVTETGNVGFDIDARAAEIKALKEAIGPALTEALKEAIKSDD